MRAHLVFPFLAIAIAPALANAEDPPPPPARSEPDAPRPARPPGSYLLGLAVPDLLLVRGLDETIPVPAARLSWQVGPRLAFDLGAGILPLPYGAHFGIYHVGLRGFLGEGAPYLLARTGVYDARPDEGDRGVFLFAVGGAGVEHTFESGFSLWAELALGIVRIDEDRGSALGIHGSAGLGYRFGR